MSLEQQLRETMRRVADGLRPDAARAYDRFRRRRRRRMILMPAVAAVVIVATVMTMVAVAQRLPDPADPVQPAPTPTPTPTPLPTGPVPSPQPLPYEPGPRTVEVPAAGYAVEVPDGWLVAQRGTGLRLRPESEPRAEIQIGTIALKPELGPGKGEDYPATTHFPETGFHFPLGPYTYSRRPDGRRVLKAGEGATDASYYIAWPYHCAADVDCRVYTKLRTLHVRFYSPEAIWPEVRALGEAIVRDARPITNALPGGDDSVERESCGTAVTAGSSGSPRNPRSDVISRVELDNPSLIACSVHLELAMVVTVDGRPANVEGSGRTIIVEGPSPEGGAEPDGRFGVTWRWTNWCGPGTPQVQFTVNGVVDPVLALRSRPTSPPDCVDPSRPSRVDVWSVEQ